MGRHSAPSRRAVRAEARTQRPDRARRGRRSTPARLVAAGAGAVVLSTTVGFVGLGKQVQVVVDGEQRTITTYASDVRGALVDAGVPATAHDVVVPSPSATLVDGATIDVTKGRRLTVTVDGHSSTHYVAARTTAEAVQQLGLGDYSVVSSRSSRLPLHGGALELATYRPVTVSADGKQQVVYTAGRDVAAALDDAGITLGETDQVAPAADTPLTPGTRIQVTRVGEHTVTEQRAVPHQTIEQSDPGQYVGIDTVQAQGSDGVESVTVEVSTVNGVETARTEIAKQTVTPPVDAVVVKGAKPFPADVDALNWQALGMCESTNNPKAVNKTNGKYFGEYQFSVETWAGVGGTGNPADAPAAEQLARAKMLFMQYGAGQWECGSHLYD
ncbi:resuscitation-promoting factor [Cumulibacter manganitolerans]|uniref:resuscitation-promoting factor n=1 Tax=Cumulibacter manganitolerans TaxID=1884992 RepID=UPI001885BD6D|nr:resuscitation-promoting factor [Cumulibacter manganitolerans]